LEGTEGERGVQGYWGDLSGRRNLEGIEGKTGVQGYGETGVEEGIWLEQRVEGRTGLLGRLEWKKAFVRHNVG